MTSAPTRQLNWAGKAVLLFGGVLPGIATGTISVMLPGISEAFGGGGESNLLITMVATAAGLGMMLGAPIGGYIADRVGRRFVLVAAVALFATFGLSAMLVSELWQLIAARLVIGFASGAMTATYVAIIADNFDDKAQGKWVGFNASIAVLFVVLLNPVAGALVDTGWRNGFLVYAVSLPVLLLAVLGIPKRDPAEDEVPEQTNLMGLIRAIPRLGQTALLATIGGTLATGTVLYWPFRFRELGITSAEQLAYHYIPNVMVVFIAAFSYGWVRKWLSVNQVFAVSGAISAFGLLIVALAPDPITAAVGLTIEGAAIGLMTPNLSIYAISIAPAHSRARVVGLMKGVYYGSPFLTQFALEGINAVAGISATLLAIAAMSFCLTLYMLIEMKRGTVVAPATADKG
ncbi:MFS transporter [Erythrobacter litoralis]|uniref:MFS transporter n=1 Tax=Erythrobacter litoralis TaxID=39960 RepID=UPI0024349892|nr:MFS transporter [Erythrobacter litoralis]